LWAALAVVAVVVLALFLRAANGKSASKPETTATYAVAPKPISQVVVKNAPGVAPLRAATAPTVVRNDNTAQAAHMQPGWYVVAYTFNHEDQATKRAAAISKRYPALRPEVIAPGGRAPFLVALGGVMSRAEAEAARNRARQAGMPRDTFARNYKGS
jgi:hypothetical protein